jgi:hypothetical protein
MTKTVTQDDVLRYLFKETTEEENLIVETQLLVDAKLMDFYKESKALINDIKSLNMEPSAQCLKGIIDYSQSMSLHSIS